jgi:hypothetical protein
LQRLQEADEAPDGVRALSAVQSATRREGVGEESYEQEKRSSESVRDTRVLAAG